LSRLSFLTRILLNYGSDKDCPFCGSPATRLKQRKQYLLELRSCPSCGLMFRWPKSTPSFAERYYQEGYKESSFTTSLPAPAELAKLLACNFRGTPKDFSKPIAILKEFLPAGRVLDFGSSWGYGTHQLNQAGYDALGFEISRPRAAYGREHLHLEILDRLEDLPSIPSKSVDAIFANHVFEHLLSLKEPFELFARILKPGGIALIAVPNAGGELARELGTKWQTLINEKHTLALDSHFFERNLPAYGFEVRVFADPFSIPDLRHAIDHKLPLGANRGEELFVLAKRVLPDRRPARVEGTS
jgi:SAM-dependent methyltransferase